LVQAVIAENGNAVILVADRLLTRWIGPGMPPHEFESVEPKIFSRRRVAIAFSGSELWADRIWASIEDQKLEEYEEIVKSVSEQIQNERKRFIDKEIKRRTGVESEQFFTRPDLPIPPEVRERIYGIMGEIDQRIINIHCLVAGFNNVLAAKLSIIDSEGDVTDVTKSARASIGSGGPFSTIYFDLYEYVKDMTKEDSLIFSFKAKKWSEAPSGVGPKTDIVVLWKANKGKDVIRKKVFLDSGPVVKKLEKYHEQEKAMIERRRNKLKEALKDEFEG